MVVTDNGLAGIAIIVGNSGTVPGFIAIGSSSTAASGNDVALGNETDRNAITSTDLSLLRKVTWTGDFSSTEISGLRFQEFGLFNSGAGGTLFNREVIGSIVFEGDRELQIQNTYEFFRSGA